MPNDVPRPLHWSASLVALLLLGGCSAAGYGTSATPAIDRPASTMTSVQLIIKFRPGALQCAPAGVSALSVAAGVRLDLVRPMSGDACVVRLWGATTNDLAAGQERLKRHAAVEWLEPDTIMRAS